MGNIAVLWYMDPFRIHIRVPGNLWHTSIGVPDGLINQGRLVYLDLVIDRQDPCHMNLHRERSLTPHDVQITYVDSNLNIIFGG